MEVQTLLAAPSDLGEVGGLELQVLKRNREALGVYKPNAVLLGRGERRLRGDQSAGYSFHAPFPRYAGRR